MQRTIEAIYKDGVFKPLERVELKEGEHIKIRIEENTKENAVELAKKYSGIGNYQGKVDAEKLHRIEADMLG
ncbi:hypothetical protein AIOGIFDO_01916 [Candidatus Methanoperedenaceae archaeon GB37]|nr:hypothetical protein AIOGIFDO_01916 [Candidatus Methanoperedenaceae archaeon GB37]